MAILHVVVIDPAQVAEAAAIVHRITGTERHVDPAVRPVTAPTPTGWAGWSPWPPRWPKPA